MPPAIPDARARLHAWGLLFLWALAGCAGPSALATLTTPARLPLKTIPFVLVVNDDGEARGTLDDMMNVLRSSGVDARASTTSAVAELRRSGGMPRASAVVDLAVEYRSSVTTQARDRQETICGPRGCTTRPRTDFVQVPTLTGTLVVRVYEGPSGRPLQRLRLSAQAQVGTVDVLHRDNVLRQLTAQVLSALDPQRQTLRIRLRNVDVGGHDEALRSLSVGDWTAGRRALETLRGAAEDLDPGAQAAFLYNLSIARRFDPESLAANEAQHFDQAEAALVAAIRLDPDPTYAAALEAVRRHRRERSVLAAQTEATGENFRAAEAPGVSAAPPPPNSYRQVPTP